MYSYSKCNITFINFLMLTGRGIFSHLLILLLQLGGLLLVWLLLLR